MSSICVQTETQGQLPQTFSDNNSISDPKTKNPNISVEVCI